MFFSQVDLTDPARRIASYRDGASATDLHVGAQPVTTPPHLSLFDSNLSLDQVSSIFAPFLALLFLRQFLAGNTIMAAEAIGVVGSAVGFAGFAFQIADGINKLIDFCQAVKGAPEDLRTTISELQELGELYQEIGQQIGTQQQINVASLPSQAVLDRILARCKRNNVDLQMLLSDMDAEVNRRPIRGSMKVVLKKDILLKFLSRVERSKTSLLLSYTLYYKSVSCMSYVNEILTDLSSELARQETISVRKELQKISAVAPHITAMPPQIDMLVNHAVSSKASTSCPVGSIQKQHTPHLTTHHSTRTLRQTTRLTLRLPYWLSCRTYDLAFHRSISGWNVSIQTRNIVPSDSTFFQACIPNHTRIGFDVSQLVVSDDLTILARKKLKTFKV